jgi:hypothetical protein
VSRCGAAFCAAAPGPLVITIDVKPEPIRIYKDGKLIGTAKSFTNSPPIDGSKAYVLKPYVLPKRETVFEGAFDYIKFNMVGEFTAEAPRRDPCPRHYTGDPELPCRCPKPPSPYDVVVDGVDG